MSSRSLLIVVAAGWLIVAAAVAAIVWDDFGGWLEDTAPLAEWLVAAGTFALALATYALARRAAEEAQAVRDEAKIVADQVALQREQMEAAQRPVVYPVTPTDWARQVGLPEWSRVLPVANGGPGVALNVMGHLMRRGEGSGSGYYSSQILAGSVGPGSKQYARLESTWSDLWDGTIGYLRYWDVLGGEWYTDFACNIAVGNQLSIEAKPPRRAGEPDAPEYPPPEWSRA